MLSILDYRLSEYRKNMKLSLIWLILLTFIILLLVLFQENMKIRNYLIDFGYVDKDGYILVESNDLKLNDILNNYQLIINENIYDYDVYQIKDDYIYLKTDIPDKIKIENNIVNFKILLNEVSITSYVFETLGGIKNE